MSEPFIAEIRIWANNFAPRGWAVCDGQLLPISQNTALFSLVGTTYGGDGRTTFGLPNLSGRLPMHPGRGPGLSDRRLGQTAGAETASLNEAQIAAHSHSPQGFPTTEAANPTSTRGIGAAVLYAPPGTVVAMAADIVGDTGGGAAHSNLQPYLSLNFCIALTGLYPSRS
jgi:microcystin-dependent protein